VRLWFRLTVIVCDKLKRVILTLNMWFKANSLFMNLKKTHFLQIRKSFLCTHFWNIQLNHPDAKAVSRTNTGTHKFLGVAIAKMLNWKEYIDKLVLDLRSLGYVFRKLVKYSEFRCTNSENSVLWL